jgi:hypothetical protein
MFLENGDGYQTEYLEGTAVAWEKSEYVEGTAEELGDGHVWLTMVSCEK